MIDLRSDTVTRPTPEMRRAMSEAEVGDDVYGEDPTVNRLEARAAEIFGRQAALFVPTGTMGNQVAIRLLTQPGQEVIAESRAHILDYEMATTAAFSGCLIRAVPTEDGILTWKHIEPAISHYGGFRAAKVARILINDQGIVPSAILMLSPTLETSFQFGGEDLALGAAGLAVTLGVLLPYRARTAAFGPTARPTMSDRPCIVGRCVSLRVPGASGRCRTDAHPA